MNRIIWAKKKTIIALALCAIIAASSIIILQNTRTTEAALIEPHPGLVGWWRFDEGSGSVAGDNSGNGNNGTITGATWVTGRYGKALSFNGATDYVSVPDSASLRTTGDWTRTFWVYSDVPLIGTGVLNDVWTQRTTSNKFLFRIGTDGAWLVLYRSTGAGFSEIAIPNYYQTWTFVSVVKNGADLTIYENGSIVATANNAENEPDDSHALFLACTHTGLAQFLDGIIDEIHVYNRALSEAEVQESFQKRPDFSSKLLAKVPKGTTQVIVTLSWQGIGSINVTMQTPSKSYTEDTMSVYQKTVYSTSDGTTSMLNIKRLSISVSALSSDENWYIMLESDDVEDYRITVEAQK